NAFIAGEPLPPHGNNLRAAIKGDGKIMPELTVKLGWQIAQALAAAHALNVTHSFLTTESIWVFADPEALRRFRPKSMDLGGQAFMKPGAPEWRSQRMEALGLPYSAAPEQCRAGLIDFRGDAYSLGCIFSHMIAGRPPFAQLNANEVAHAHQNVVVR